MNAQNTTSRQSFFATNGVACVSVYADDQQGAVIALYGDQRRSAVPEVAISVGLDCTPRLQVARNGTVNTIDLGKTIEALACLGTLTQQQSLPTG